MGKNDHYIFMDGCIVKGCRPQIEFEATFGEYASLLESLYHKYGWGRGERRLFGLPLTMAREVSFERWADVHIHIAQSTQNMRTGAMRIDRILRSIGGEANIHLFGTSAAGAAILEYFLLCDPQRLYYHRTDHACSGSGSGSGSASSLRPARRYDIDPRITSFTTIDAPANWIPLRRDTSLRPYRGRDALGVYLASHTRVKAGFTSNAGNRTARMEDVPDTWVESEPVAGIYYDDRPHYDYLPRKPLPRHIYTGSHISHESRIFLERVWR